MDTARSAVRVHVVDPPAYTPPYDHALCAGLARAGADVTLHTTRFAHGEVPAPEGYRREETFYRWAPREPLRRPARLGQHVPDMLRYARRARAADVVHFQWLPVQQVDPWLLPRGRPVVLTAHDVLPREGTRRQIEGQRRLYDRVDAVLVHSDHGARRLRDEARVDPAKVHVIPHGAFHHLARTEPAPLPPELATPSGTPVVLCFGLMRPYKGIDVLLEAWREVSGAELWIVGAPRMDIAPLRAAAPPGVRWLPRFVSDAEAVAIFRRADVVTLPYREIDQSGVLFTALAFAKPLVLSTVGGFGEIDTAVHVAPGDAAALGEALQGLIEDPDGRARLSAAAAQAAAPDGRFGWDAIARRHLVLYAALVGSHA
jgi:glycosyltransferase involved in cell wall biosynthesis